MGNDAEGDLVMIRTITVPSWVQRLPNHEEQFKIKELYLRTIMKMFTAWLIGQPSRSSSVRVFSFLERGPSFLRRLFLTWQV